MRASDSWRVAGSAPVCGEFDRRLRGGGIERLLVAFVLLFLVWLPLPLGSNRDWAVGVFVTGMGILGLIWAFLQWRHTEVFRFNPAWRPALPLFGLLCTAQVWVAAQWLGSVTVDEGATFQYLMLGIAYSLLFLLTVSLFHTRTRLTLLLATLVVSGDPGRLRVVFYRAEVVVVGRAELECGREGQTVLHFDLHRLHSQDRRAQGGNYRRGDQG